MQLSNTTMHSPKSQKIVRCDNMAPATKMLLDIIGRAEDCLQIVGP